MFAFFYNTELNGEAVFSPSQNKALFEDNHYTFLLPAKDNTSNQFYMNVLLANNSEIKAYSRENIKSKNLDASKLVNSIHAEQLITFYLLNIKKLDLNDKNLNLYYGISKLCCVVCEKLSAQFSSIKIRGGHRVPFKNVSDLFDSVSMMDNASDEKKAKDQTDTMKSSFSDEVASGSIGGGAGGGAPLATPAAASTKKAAPQTEPHRMHIDGRAYRTIVPGARFVSTDAPTKGWITPLLRFSLFATDKSALAPGSLRLKRSLSFDSGSNPRPSKRN